MEAQKGGKRRLVLGIFAQVDAGKTTLSRRCSTRPAHCARSAASITATPISTRTSWSGRAASRSFPSRRALKRSVSPSPCSTRRPCRFAPEAERVMPVIDCALLLVSGTDGVQGHTLTLWRLLQHYGVPVVLFFNKMDLPGADPRRPAGRCAHRAQRPLCRAGRRRVRRPQLRSPAGALSEHRRIG